MSRPGVLPGERTDVKTGPDDYHQKAPRERTTRWRILAESFLGVTLLITAQRWQPPGGEPFAGPHGAAAWLAAVCGILGVWFVPGGWFSALVMRTGTGPIARLATRVGALLAWYAVVGVVVHYLAQGADPTAWSIIGVTSASTAAICLGVALGLLPRPVDPRMRILVFAAAGGICAQVVIWLAMEYWTYQINYQHIRRLDWLIVVVCALLAALGGASRPTLPVRGAARLRGAIVGWFAITMTAAVTVVAAAIWPTTQLLPSEIAAEQVSAPAGADVALALAGIGPHGSAALRGVAFATVDERGRPVPARFRVTDERGTTDRTTLLVVLDPTARSALCGPTSVVEQADPVKVTLRELRSGTSTQAVLPAGWCAG
ncbi:MAG: hypothetical protein ACRDRX_16350 [Pseudonocardiaceae bacterium]